MSQDILMKLGQVEAIAKAAHDRMDRQDELVKDELTEIKRLMGEISIWMHQTKARNDVAKYIVGILLGGGGVAIVKFLSRGAM